MAKFWVRNIKNTMYNKSAPQNFKVTQMKIVQKNCLSQDYQSKIHSQIVN